MKKILPVLIILIAAIGGATGGMMFRPAAEMAGGEDPMGGGHEGEMADTGHGMEKPADPSMEDMQGDYDYVKFSRQFVIPVVGEDGVRALVVADIQLEVEPGTSEEAFSREPKLRDAFLKVLYRIAHTGGFNGSLVSDYILKDMHDDLKDAAAAILGGDLHDVLITDLLRQDL